MKRPAILLPVAVLCLLLAYTWSYWAPQKAATSAFQKALPEYLKEKAAYPNQLLKDSTFLNYFLERNELRYLEEVEKVVQQLETLENTGVGFFILDKDEILLSSASVDWQVSDSFPLTDEGQFLFIQEEEIWLVRRSILKADIQAIVFLPLHEAPYANYLHFSPDQSAADVQIQLEGIAPIGLSEKQSLPRPLMVFFLLLFGGGILWYYLNLRIVSLSENGKLYASAVWALVSAGLLIWWFQSSIWVDQRSLLRPLWSSPLLPDTLLGLLGQVLVVLWFFRVFYGLFAQQDTYPFELRRWILTPLLYGLGLSSLLGVAYWLKVVISGSQVFFNLDQVLKLGLPGLVVALSLILWLMAVFLLVKRLTTVVHRWSIPLNYRLMGILLGIILSYGVLFPLSLGISFWVWLLLAFIFLVLIDLQLDSGAFNLTWLMVWLILLSTFSASLTYKFSLEKELGFMKTQRDQLLSELSQKGGKELYELFNKEEQRYGLLLLPKDGPYEGNGFINALNWETVRSLADGKNFASITNKMIQVGARQGEEVIVLQKELGSYFRPLSLFALYFSLFLLLLLVLVVWHSRQAILPDFLLPVFKTRNSLRNRIQLAVIGIILLSSVVIAFVTIWYFRDTAVRTQERQVLEKLRQLEQELTAGPIEQLKLSEIKNKIGTSFAIYNTQGAKLYDGTDQVGLSYWLPASTLEELRLALVPFQFQSTADQRKRLALAAVQSAEGQIKLYAGLPFSRYSEERAREINNFVGSVFSLYVFFMFIAGGIAIWVANSITEPISKIGEGLRNLRLGGNAPLTWKNRDEIGLLVEEYNAALAKLDESTRQLRKAEREGAWRDMAQQVAHEIKNPLTPMKLSVQHLLRAYQANPDAIGPLLKSMSATLIEQIEGLTKIANEFSNFAKMPEAQLERLNVSQLLRSVVDLFEHQAAKVKFSLNVPSDDCYVVADKDQLLRVFNNLLNNAVQAIPDSRSGNILVRLKPLGDRVQLIFQDNGSGIPPSLQEKVFYPYFTTKSSGTGIGLSMCRNIIEQFGGRIYFTTKEQEGTIFYVELQAAE